jgi:DNA-binding LacI/PurR family transcriptional regulator
VYLAAEQVGLRIGKDVFVVDFGNMPLCRQLSVPLSSIDQASKEVGYEAAKLLYLTAIGSIKCPMHRKVLSELHIRESSTGKTQHPAVHHLSQQKT